MKTLKLCLAQAALVCAFGAFGEVQVDTKLPAGCVIVQGVEGDTVRLEHDFRTTQGGWFYWAFRVTGAEGRTLKFQFDKKYWAAVGSRGAAVSTDCGASWRWSDAIDPSAAKDELGDHADVRGFAYAFGPNDKEVWLSQTIPYGLREWKAFLGEFSGVRGKLFEELTLCKTKKGREVPLVRFGRLDGKARYRAFVASRHHCQEASATFVVEGMMRAAMADDELGRWCRENVEFRVVPFVDLDGVVEGDQGKNRTPWDHARDYNEAKPQEHPEVAAIMKMLKTWKPTYVQDTHAPWLRGSWKQKDNTNEYVYQVGNAENGAQIAAFGAILERVQKAGLGYRAADNVPFGVGWNSGKNYTQGKTLNAWAQTDLRTAAFVTTFEIPFANQREVTLGPANLKAFGRDILTAWREYVGTAVDGRRAASSSTGNGHAEVKTATAGAFAVECAKPDGWRFALKAETKGRGIEEVRLVAETDVASVPPPFAVKFSVPKGRLQHVWNPFEQSFPCCWTDQESSFSVGLPLRVNFDDDETNVLTVAVSDALNAIRFRTDVDMMNGNAHRMNFTASFFDDPNPPRTRYETVFRLDSRSVFWSQAAEEGVRWISAASARQPAVPPAAAYEPLYSSWYVFRQTVTEKAMDAELERAAKLGMKTAILDDGWQTDCGDWGVDTNKFPNLKGHVARAHRLGMKYLLWFALPHLLSDSPAWARFKDMRISEKPDYWGDYIFDPRHPEVRAHLVKRLVELARDYGFDGFKLDFIDQFVAQGDDDLAAKNGFAGCDYRSVPEATERLLKDISAALRAVKPEMLIEFRQRYVGPVVRQYGNMLRANDCPGDYAANRCRTLALRVTSPGSAIHSDMLMWRSDDSAAEVMRQMWNVAFSVIQYSACLKDLPAAHLDVIRKSIGFMNEHRRTLLFGKLTPHRPDLGYPCVEAESGSERIIVVYAPEYVVRIPEDGKRTLLVNATRADSLVVERDGRIARHSVRPSDYLAFGVAHR